MTTKKEFRNHLAAVGIPKFLAKLMVKLVTIDNIPGLMSDPASQCILGFAHWRATPEGFDFWNALASHFAALEAKK